MLLQQGTVDTRDHGIGGKYDSDMAVYLDWLYLNGDRGDEDAVHEVNTEGAARYGKWIFGWTEQGFVWTHKHGDEAEAINAFANIRLELEGEPEDEEADQESAF